MCIGNITAYFLHVNAYVVSKAAAFKKNQIFIGFQTGFVKILEIWVSYTKKNLEFLLPEIWLKYV